jgi:hypothetical protein
MPLVKGKSKKTISGNISEFHGGKTFARTKRKYGVAKARKQAIAVALKLASKTAKKKASKTAKKKKSKK